MAADSINPYAAPQVELLTAAILGEDGSRSIWRDGNLLVLRKGAELPSRCVKCNAPATKMLKRDLSWHHPALYLVILIGLLIYIIVALVVRHTARVHVGLCDLHRAQRRKAIFVAWGLFLGAFVLFFAIAYAPDAATVWLVIGGIVLLVAGPAYGLWRAQIVSPKRIDKSFVWLDGVCTEYLSELPVSPPLR